MKSMDWVLFHVQRPKIVKIYLTFSLQYKKIGVFLSAPPQITVRQGDPSGVITPCFQAAILEKTNT